MVAVRILSAPCILRPDTCLHLCVQNNSIKLCHAEVVLCTRESEGASRNTGDPPIHRFIMEVPVLCITQGCAVQPQPRRPPVRRSRQSDEILEDSDLDDENDDEDDEAREADDVPTPPVSTFRCRKEASGHASSCELPCVDPAFAASLTPVRCLYCSLVGCSLRVGTAEAARLSALARPGAMHKHVGAAKHGLLPCRQPHQLSQAHFLPSMFNPSAGLAQLPSVSDTASARQAAARHAAVEMLAAVRVPPQQGRPDLWQLLQPQPGTNMHGCHHELQRTCTRLLV